MQPEASLSQLARKLEKYIYNLRPVREQNTLPTVQRKLIQRIAQYVSLARAQIEFSLGDEDFEARPKGFQLAAEQLQVVSEGILEASMYDLVDTVEVAQFTAMTELCTDRIKQLQSME